MNAAIKAKILCRMATLNHLITFIDNLMDFQWMMSYLKRKITIIDKLRRFKL